MKCNTPKVFISPSDNETLISVPCGKCISCQVNKSQNWSFRAEVELKNCVTACFITLTYENNYLPEYHRDDKYLIEYTNEHLKKFYKNIRNNISRYNVFRRFHTEFTIKLDQDCQTKGLRYMTVPELGEKTSRFHHHSIMFNLPFVQNNIVSKNELINFLKSCWPYGLVHVGEVNTKSINYVAKYCVKDSEDRNIGVKLPRVSVSKGFGLQYLTPEMINYYKTNPSERQYLTKIGGKKQPMSDYYKKRLYTPEQLEQIKSDNEYYNSINPSERLNDEHIKQLEDSIKRRSKRRKTL